MVQSSISSIVGAQRSFFSSGKTRDVHFRRQQLEILKRAIWKNEEAIVNALQADLRKPALEVCAAEVCLTVREADHAAKHLRSWARAARVPTPLMYFPASSHVYREPLGLVLIMGPWNFPFQLMVIPLVGAIAAGDCAILKPSEISSHTSSALARIVRDSFDPSYIAVLEGGPTEAQSLLSERFDHIFFTGGTTVGGMVMEAAARHLTPVTLELGGKSPCIVERGVPLEITARRITWGKFINAGQSCVAPDYLLVQKGVKEPLLEHLKRSIREFYGEDPSKSPDYARIINERHFQRLSSLLEEGRIVIGGDRNIEDHYIAPTIIDDVELNYRVMEEEIFGPILPVVEYEDLAEAISIVNGRPKPLALYLFSADNKNQQRVLNETSSGGVCINDTTVHFATNFLPFGGVGPSGIGSYHGKATFDTLTHQKSALRREFFLDIKTRYPPYQGKVNLIRRLMQLG
jgi:aldehyde dehydrogenase (NAD+)